MASIRGPCTSFMKKNIVSVSMLALVLSALPGLSRAQNKPTIDTSRIPPSQRLQNWDDSTNAKGMSGVVVVAYGAQKKAAVTGAIAQVTDSMIAKRPLTNIAEALT